MKRECKSMCRYGRREKGTGEDENAIVKRWRPELSPSDPCKHQAANKENPSPQPRVIQILKRRQSGKSPVGDGADLVVFQGPASANHRR
jgi:hypothetical protein